MLPVGNALATGEEGAATSSNPLSGDEAAIKAGKTKYRAGCAYCHGARANGRGRGLPNSADLRKFKRGFSKFVRAVKNGYKTMPPWGGMGEISNEEIRQIGAYLETLGIRGSNWLDPVADQSRYQERDSQEPASQTMAALLEGIGIALSALTIKDAMAADYEAHLDRVRAAWPETPGGVGLTATLEAEARIAQQHAGLAVADLEDFDTIKLHTRHVRHAVDPDREAGGGPGKGYGLCRAARGVVRHMALARDTADASPATATHAPHVIAAAANIVFWCGKILDKAGQIVGGASPIASAFFAEEIVEHLEWIVNGRDGDGDGAVTWAEGEGGLAQLNQHLGYIE
jgi:mono/diheme cytochrome c family protein